MNNYNKLRQLAPYAKCYVLNCNNIDCWKGIMEYMTEFEVDDSIPWLLRLRCSICNDKWSICTSCKKFKVPMKTKRQLNLHKNTYHSTKKNETIMLNVKKRPTKYDEIEHDKKCMRKMFSKQPNKRRKLNEKDIINNINKLDDSLVVMNVTNEIHSDDNNNNVCIMCNEMNSKSDINSVSNISSTNEMQPDEEYHDTKLVAIPYNNQITNNKVNGKLRHYIM